MLPGLSRRRGEVATEEVAHWPCIRGRRINERLTACERIICPVWLRAGLGLARLRRIVEEVTLVGALRYAKVTGRVRRHWVAEDVFKSFVLVVSLSHVLVAVVTT